MKKISIYTFLTSNSKLYAELLYATMIKFWSYETNLKFFCVESNNCDGSPNFWETIKKTKNNKGHNCYNHAHAMHIAQTHAKSSNCDYCIFVDCDIAILYPSWDLVVCSELECNDIFGTAFGDDSVQYNRFPNVFFFCFRKDVFGGDFEFDFSPDIDKNGSPKRIRLTDIDRAYLKDQDKKILKCDTGWKIPFLAHFYSMKGSYMPRVLGSDKNSKLPYSGQEQKIKCIEKPLHMAEWHYKNELYLTHKQASRNHPLNGVWGSIWKARIDTYIKLTGF